MLKMSSTNQHFIHASKTLSFISIKDARGRRHHHHTDVEEKKRERERQRERTGPIEICGI